MGSRPARPDLYFPAATSAAGRVVPPQFNLEEADSSLELLKSHFKVSSASTMLQQAPTGDVFLPLGNAGACRKQEIARVGVLKARSVNLLFPHPCNFLLFACFVNLIFPSPYIFFSMAKK